MDTLDAVTVIHEKPKVRSSKTARSLQPVHHHFVAKPAAEAEPLTTGESFFPLSLNAGWCKLLLLVPVFLTVLYAHSYQGQHQLVINNQVTGMLNVLFTGLFISVLFFWLKPYKVALWAFLIVSMSDILQIFRLPFYAGYEEQGIFSGHAALSFDPVNLLFCFLGAAVLTGLLTILDSHKETEYTEVY